MKTKVTLPKHGSSRCEWWRRQELAHGGRAVSMVNVNGTGIDHVTNMKWTRQFRTKLNSTYEVHHSYRYL